MNSQSQLGQQNLVWGDTTQHISGGVVHLMEQAHIVTVQCKWVWSPYRQQRGGCRPSCLGREICLCRCNRASPGVHLGQDHESQHDSGREGRGRCEAVRV